MTDIKAIREHMDVIGADGAHVGTVDCVRGDRLVLTKGDSAAELEDGASGQPEARHHYVSMGLVAGIEGNQVRLSATGANVQLLEEDEQLG